MTVKGDGLGQGETKTGGLITIKALNGFLDKVNNIDLTKLLMRKNYNNTQVYTWVVVKKQT